MDHPAPLIVTKVLRPRRRDDLLHRHRLVDFIHAHIDRKLIIITAPVSYGKTSLLIDYAHETDLPVCWYTLDERDSDPQIFLEYLVASIRRHFPNFGQQIEALLHDESSFPDWEAVAGILVNDMVENIDEHVVIVLDDYHLIDDDSAVHDFLDTLLRYLPEHCHILLASRTLPPLTLTRLTAHQEVDGLGINELRFTAHEIQQLMKQNYDLDLSDEQAQKLAQELDGWIAGLLLTKHDLWKGLFAGMIRAKGETQVFEYLATEVFEQQPEDSQKFLLYSAILDQMSPAMCNALLKIENAQEVLRSLESQNVFILRLEGSGEWYRYHQLFREFLLTRLRNTDPKRYHELHLEAAELFIQQSEPATAIRHYLQAEAFDRAAEIIASVADETFNTGRWVSLDRWIGALPRDVLSEQPRLIIHQAKTWIQLGQLTDAVRELDRACEIFQAAGEEEYYAEALTFKSVALRLQGRCEEAIQQCEQALAVLDCDESPIAAQAYRNIGISYGVLGKLSESAERLSQALRLFEAHGKAYHIASVQHDLATTYLRAGDLARASMHYRAALRHWRETNNLARISETLNGMGCALYHQGAYESARELLEEALVEAQKAQYTRAEAAVLAGLGDIARLTEEYEEALNHYEQALRAAEGIYETSIIVHVFNAMGLTHCSLRDYSQAQACITEALSLAEQFGSSYAIGLSQDALGMLFYCRSKPDMAIQHFTEARNRFNECGAKRELAIADLHLAQAFFKKTPSSNAIDYLEQAFALADKLGYDHFFIAEGKQSVELYRYAGTQPDFNGQVTHILEHWGEEIPETPSEEIPETPSKVETHASDTEPVLRVHALGPTQVWLHGEQVTKKQWESTTTKELFFYLLAHPEGVRKDKILEVFWPEATPEKGSSAFHSTNYRLRQAFKDHDCILYKNGVYTINPEISYWYDVEAFQELIEKAENADSAEERASAYLEAIELYKGDYLEEFYSDWNYFQRDKLQRQYFDALIHVAEYSRKHDQVEEALSLYNKIITEDPYQEKIHREIMRVHLELGQRAAAVKHYQELRVFLREDLDIDPMPETIALYKSILNGEKQQVE